MVATPAPYLLEVEQLAAAFTLVASAPLFLSLALEGNQAASFT